MLRPSRLLAILGLARGPAPRPGPALAAARACFLERSYREARAFYERALAADPGCAEARRGIERCRTLD